jgi:thiosulfate reductase cytochrome b subunit
VSAPGTERAEAADGIPLRRGLPRTAGGDPWPPAGTVASARATAAALDEAAFVGAALDEAALDGAALDEAAFEGTESPAVLAAEGAAPAAAPVAAVAPVVPAGGSGPLPFVRTVWDGRAPRRVPATPASDAAKRRPTWPQAIAGLFAAAGLGVLAAAAVAFVRTLLSLDPLQEFLAAFPGHYEPAIHVEPGFAPWVGWQHFFNMFLMVLIIRSGLTIRREKRPTAFWTPRKNPKGKVSLTIWFHQALDVLWLVNGAVFVVLLFATGHWVRIVPTSWEVLPNALSAALQYVSLDWPTENGWNNYNSLQQLAYFVTVFLAAPLAAVTGFRMSGLWPKKAERLSKAYPIEWARKVHFPVMLYFVLFIIAHVALVFLTGMLANLNHMFASSDAAGWAGFWVFVAALAVIAAGWAAARPLVIAPIAKLFGTVSGR